MGVIVTTFAADCDQMLKVSISALFRRAIEPARADVVDAKTDAANPALLNAVKSVDVRSLGISGGIQGVKGVNRRIKWSPRFY